MSTELIIRTATIKDDSFLAEAIIAAEKSGTDILSYNTLFGVKENDFAQMLPEIFEEEIEGQELCRDGFLIAEVEGKPAGAVCSWIEAEEGMSSAMLKSSVLMHFFPQDAFEKASLHKELIKDLNFNRSAGALQIESVYVKTEYRGLKIAPKLIDEHIRRYSVSHQYDLVEILLSGDNKNALRAYEKNGFVISERKESRYKDAEKILPSKSRVKMTKKLD